MVGIAVLGAGIFARDEHLPAIAVTEGLDLRAIYSRSQKSAQTLAASTKPQPDIYYDSPGDSGKSLDDLLARNDIEAVVICLPILAQPEVIKKALSAGKHVLSEKPIAKDVETAKDLIDWHGKLPAPRPVWAVAENFRYIEAVRYAAGTVKEVGGKLVTFRLQQNNFILESDQFYNTEWRKVPEYQGGFLLDGGVHFIGGLRLLLEAAGDDIKQLACFSALLQERLPPVDSVHSIASTRGGANGSICLSFGTEFKSALEIEVVTTEGSVVWDTKDVIVVRRGAGAEKVESRKAFGFDSGVKLEVSSFANSIRVGGTPDPLQSPEQALKDLQVLQALLESGEAKAALKTLE